MERIELDSVWSSRRALMAEELEESEDLGIGLECKS